MPSDKCILANANGLAQYALLCQQHHLVPIVEPEVLMDGTHTIDTSFDVTSKTLDVVFHQLTEHQVDLKGIVLKPNMVLSGYNCEHQANVEEVAQRTLECLTNHVPNDVPGIAFLSGGQSDELATAHLNAMNQIDGTPWNLTFSYGRALQAPTLKAWSGRAENIPTAQEALMKRAIFNGLATKGEYSSDME